MLINIHYSCLFFSIFFITCQHFLSPSLKNLLHVLRQNRQQSNLFLNGPSLFMLSLHLRKVFFCSILFTSQQSAWKNTKISGQSWATFWQEKVSGVSNSVTWYQLQRFFHKIPFSNLIVDAFYLQRWSLVTHWLFFLGNKGSNLGRG